VLGHGSSADTGVVTCFEKLSRPLIVDSRSPSATAAEDAGVGDEARVDIRRAQA
jgi:hypothetical protein